MPNSLHTTGKLLCHGDLISTYIMYKRIFTRKSNDSQYARKFKSHKKRGNYEKELNATIPDVISVHFRCDVTFMYESDLLSLLGIISLKILKISVKFYRSN